jgi:hypothetical protein
MATEQGEIMHRICKYIAAMLLGAVLAQPLHAQEDSRVAPVFRAAHAIADILNVARSQGKALVFQLHGGVSYAGRIKDVSASAVIVTELRGKEFFDAWIPFESIIAMEERVRLR